MSIQAAERLQVYAAAMDLELPPLEFEDGDLLLSNELAQFCIGEGICFEWLRCGKVETAQEQQFRKRVERLPEDDKRRILQALQIHRAERIPLDQALRRVGLSD